MLETCYENYCEYGSAYFEDLAAGYTMPMMSEYMNNNEDYVGTYVYMSGTVVDSTGNMVEVCDNITFAETVQNKNLGLIRRMQKYVPGLGTIGYTLHSL